MSTHSGAGCTLHLTKAFAIVTLLCPAAGNGSFSCPAEHDEASSLQQCQDSSRVRVLDETSLLQQYQDVSRSSKHSAKEQDGLERARRATSRKVLEERIANRKVSTNGTTVQHLPVYLASSSEQLARELRILPVPSAVSPAVPGAPAGNLPLPNLVPPAPVGNLHGKESSLTVKQVSLLLLVSSFEIIRGITMKASAGFQHLRMGALALCACSVVTMAEIAYLAPPMMLATGWAIYTMVEDNVMVLLGYIVWKERFTRLKICGQILGIAGGVLVQLPTDYQEFHWHICLATFAVTSLVMAARFLDRLLPQPKVMWPLESSDDEHSQASTTASTVSNPHNTKAIRKENSSQLLFKYGALALVVCLEVASAALMKEAKGFKNLTYTILAVISGLACTVAGMSYLSRIDLSTGWALYTCGEYTGVVLWAWCVTRETVSSSALNGVIMCGLGTLAFVLDEEGLHSESMHDDEGVHETRHERTAMENVYKGGSKTGG